MDALDRQVVEIAQQCAGLLGRRQLVEAGLSPKQITRKVGARLLHVVHRSVYSLVDGPLSHIQLCIAACLAVADGVLSHHTAATIHGLRGVPGRRLEMLVPPGRHPRVSGVHFRRSNRIPDHHVRVMPNGLRVTTAARTLFDLGGIMDAAAYRNVLTDAIERDIVTFEEVVEVGRELCGRGRPGSMTHHQLAVTAPESHEGVMSEGELLLGDALADAGIAVVRQHPVRLPSGRRVKLDLSIPELRLDIEVDHPKWHATPDGLQRDHARDNELAVADWERLRFTTEDVVHRLPTCVAIVKQVRQRLLAA